MKNVVELTQAHRDLETAIAAYMMACSTVGHKNQAIRDGYAMEKEKFMKEVERREMMLEEIKAAMAARQVLLHEANADITLQNQEAKRLLKMLEPYGNNRTHSSSVNLNTDRKSFIDRM
jgi:hypothetical protein